MTRDDRDERLRSLLARWDEAVARGAAPTPEELCRDDPDLIEAVAAEIERDRRERAFWTADTGGGSIRPADPPPVDPLGDARFSRLEKVAEGGSGVVYRAFDERLGRWIALKFPARGSRDPDDPRMVEFRREAVVAARLEHPGVVPIHVVGVDRDGRPFHAMKFVSDRTLADAVRDVHAAPADAGVPFEQRLEFRGLIQMFNRVCETVAFAHDREILHCDLKPRNVMIGDYGETLVVDWGSSLDLGAAAESGRSRDRSSGTPGYMSPEYQEGRFDAVGPASDVYSLGAILYQILAGRPAFEGDRKSIARDVSSGRFPRPLDLRPDAPRALDAVCRKAMATDPAARYRTAKELADDVDRWTAGRPTLAWPEPFAVRARRWADRHRAGVVAAMAVVVVAAVALAATVAVQLDAARRTRAARDRAESRLELASEAVARFREAVEENPGLRRDDALRRRLLGEPLAFYRKLRDDLMSDSESSDRNLGALADAAYGVGSVEAAIGSQEGAAPYFEEAVSLWSRLLARNPDDDSLRLRTARGLMNLGALKFKAGRQDEALAKLDEAKRALDVLPGGRPISIKIRSMRANLLRTEGAILDAGGRGAEAPPRWDEARKLLEGVRAEAPDDPTAAMELSNVHESTGSLMRRLKRYAEAEAAFDRALAIRTEIADRMGDDREYQYRLASLRFHRGNMLLASSGRRAAPEYERAVEILEALERRDVATLEDVELLASCQGNLALLRRNGGDEEGAARSFERVRLLFAKLVEANPKDVRRRSLLAVTLHNMAETGTIAARPDRVEALLREAIVHQTRALADRPESPAFRDHLNSHYLQLGRLLCRSGRDQEAADLVATRLALWTNDPKRYAEAALEYSRCAKTAAAKGSPAAAGRFAAAGIEALRRAAELGSADVEILSDPDMSTLAARPEFRGFAAKIFDRAMPKNPFRR